MLSVVVINTTLKDQLYVHCKFAELIDDLVNYHLCSDNIRTLIIRKRAGSMAFYWFNHVIPARPYLGRGHKVSCQPSLEVALTHIKSTNHTLNIGFSFNENAIT